MSPYSHNSSSNNIHNNSASAAANQSNNSNSNISSSKRNIRKPVPQGPGPNQERGKGIVEFLEMSGLGAIRNLTRLGGVPISHARKLNVI
ncbi:8447_t:CDS:2 [Entrophospora sp. SA101]|nr:8447_t:CDS:2 [Entrophospora sp. SA101]